MINVKALKFYALEGKIRVDNFLLTDCALGVSNTEFIFLGKTRV
ncbi:hypothetical protein SAMN04488034_103310 [Salinimicrobium catena]|uniref:Uncharacterized protein n=1 Tax=Salinimicrobium catena TaxID=390640 RepID=A0A1H5N674_9FLAO|nr:hypothetical protein SAMN04488140_103310 [Salinimicrobium catena]SEE96168.1 hypothetical protein SAMN04488034_103310 [Salinimicrobium catena]